MMLVIYVASLIRSILALHKLIDNKEQRLWAEKEAAKPKVRGQKRVGRGEAVEEGCVLALHDFGQRRQRLFVEEARQGRRQMCGDGRLQGK